MLLAQEVKPAIPEAAPAAAQPAPAPPVTEAPAAATEEPDLTKQAVTELSQVDTDYHEQGEYSGEIQLDGCRYAVGLQVMAMGGGKFDALLYRGGLPGNGYDCSPARKLTGSRDGDRVTINGTGLAIYLQHGFAAVVKTTGGLRLGFLQPVKRVSQTMGAKPPANAIVLFNGQASEHLLNAKVTSDGLLEVGCETKDVYQNFSLHAEFRIPYMPYARGQGRGNSGFYLQRRYEVQVLDSFGLESQFNDCASLYRFRTPDLNMCFPPLRWQTYDITFQGARFAPTGEKVCKARITVIQNGIPVHNNVELENKTGGGKPEGANPLHILIQNHRNPVQFRNIWLIDHEKTGYSQWPVMAASASLR